MRRPPSTTRTDAPFPYTTLFRAWWPTPSLRMTTTANRWRSSISFRPEKPIERKDDVMKKKDADTVRFQLDPGNLPPWTEAQKAELDALQAMPDSGIDYSDAPTLTEDFWKTAERGRFYKPIKQQVTARLDADVLAWLKSQGKGYQARMNEILRREMLSSDGRRVGKVWEGVGRYRVGP